MPTPSRFVRSPFRFAFPFLVSHCTPGVCRIPKHWRACVAGYVNVVCCNETRCEILCPCLSEPTTPAGPRSWSSRLCFCLSVGNRVPFITHSSLCGEVANRPLSSCRQVILVRIFRYRFVGQTQTYRAESLRVIETTTFAQDTIVSGAASRRGAV